MNPQTQKKLDLDLFLRRLDDFASPEMDESWYDAKRMRLMCARAAEIIRSMSGLTLEAIYPEPTAARTVDTGRGRGRIAADGATDLKRTNITIDKMSSKTLRIVGDGDLSLGIRRTARLLTSSPKL